MTDSYTFRTISFAALALCLVALPLSAHDNPQPTGMETESTRQPLQPDECEELLFIPSEGITVVSLGQESALRRVTAARTPELADASSQAASEYAQGRPAEAARLLFPFLASNREDLELLNQYARSLYTQFIEDVTARILHVFPLYYRLVAALDERIVAELGDQLAPGRPVAIVDFGEAYWKLSTLYLDLQQYDKAEYELARAMAAILPVVSLEANTRLVEQMYAYMMEATFFTKHAEANAFYACRLRKVSPDFRDADRFRLPYPEELNPRPAGAQ
ncbi:MAG: hypothetical protein K1X75_13550 [Leptospirales bacterium]|nr:hypothetical protein [Leptospirales bacterium]